MLPSDDSMVAKIELPPLKLDFEDIRKLKTYEST